MGLDNFAVQPDGSLVPEDSPLFEDVNLCGGFLTGTGGGTPSFRGKVYAAYVKDATGFSLYSPMDPTDVKLCATLLEAVPEGDPSTDMLRFDPERERRDLARFFRICADNGFGLAAWS